MPGNIAIAGKRLISRLLFLSLLLVVAYGCVEPRILRVADRRELKPTELLKEIDKSDIVFVGEVHNKKSHHKAQLEIIKALDGGGKKVAIGVEMFKKEDQEALDKWISGEIEEAEFSEIYHRNWGLPWNQYRDIFVF
ncbi:MAG: ChaN family lipoprotein, partial [Deltaproteobacteria bacterium]|nr:ChaN family lipoprotein [Deltaproteobacteria bacterium]